LSIENIRFKSGEALIAVQQAQQMAERWGQDAAIMQNLRVVKLIDVDEPPLEIVRCPYEFKRNRII
jgi:hypothetical protein